VELGDNGRQRRADDRLIERDEHGDEGDAKDGEKGFAKRKDLAVRMRRCGMNCHIFADAIIDESTTDILAWSTQ
jgi:hypothetical protein